MKQNWLKKYSGGTLGNYWDELVKASDGEYLSHLTEWQVGMDHNNIHATGKPLQGKSQAKDGKKIKALTSKQESQIAQSYKPAPYLDMDPAMMQGYKQVDNLGKQYETTQRIKEGDNVYKRYSQNAKAYLSRPQFSKSILTPDNVAEAARNFYIETGYEFPLDLALAQGQMESGLGTHLKTKNNVWNVGNFGDESQSKEYDSPTKAAYSYMNTMYNNYLDKGKKSPSELLDKGMINTEGHRYDPTNSKYEQDIKNQIGTIRKYMPGYKPSYKTGGQLQQYQGGKLPPKQSTDEVTTKNYYDPKLPPLDPNFIFQVQNRRPAEVAKAATPPRGKVSKAADIARHPMTALQYKLQGQDIPDNFQMGETNKYDDALAIVNPMTYLDAAGRTLSAKHFRDEGFTPDAVAKTILDAGMLTGLSSEIKSSYFPNKGIVDIATPDWTNPDHGAKWYNNKPYITGFDAAGKPIVSEYAHGAWSDINKPESPFFGWDKPQKFSQAEMDAVANAKFSPEATQKLNDIRSRLNTAKGDLEQFDIDKQQYQPFKPKRTELRPESLWKREGNVNQFDEGEYIGTDVKPGYEYTESDWQNLPSEGGIPNNTTYTTKSGKTFPMSDDRYSSTEGLDPTWLRDKLHMEHQNPGTDLYQIGLNFKPGYNPTTNPLMYSPTILNGHQGNSQVPTPTADTSWVSNNQNIPIPQSTLQTPKTTTTRKPISKTQGNIQNKQEVKPEAKKEIQWLHQVGDTMPVFDSSKVTIDKYKDGGKLVQPAGFYKMQKGGWLQKYQNGGINFTNQQTTPASGDVQVSTTPVADANRLAKYQQLHENDRNEVMRSTPKPITRTPQQQRDWEEGIKNKGYDPKTGEPMPLTKATNYLNKTGVGNLVDRFGDAANVIGLAEGVGALGKFAMKGTSKAAAEEFANWAPRGKGPAPLRPEMNPILTEGRDPRTLTKNEQILQGYGIEPKEELVSLYRAQPVGQNPDMNMAAQLKAKIAAGEEVPHYANEIIRRSTSTYPSDANIYNREQTYGRWFDKNPSRLKHYLEPGTSNFEEGVPLEILKYDLPKSEAMKYNAVNFPGPNTLSLSSENEFILPKELIAKAQRYPASDWQKLIDQHKAWGLLPAGFTLGTLKSAMSQDNKKYGGKITKNWLQKY